jgi:hypothetical protein
MRLRGPLVVAALVSAAFFAGYAGTSSATVLCTIQSTECPPGNQLPVPETVLATSTSALFSPTPGTSTACKASSLELKTTSNLGFSPEPLLAKVTSWTFSSCSSCTTVTVSPSPPSYKAEFVATQDGSPFGFHGNGKLKILFPEIKLSGCPGAAVCTASAASIVFEVKGGSPMKFIVSSAPMTVTGTASCGMSTAFSAEYSVVTKLKGLWLEPVP